MQTLMQDLRYGLRLLVKSPLFTFVAVLSMAIGIGASTAVFSFMYHALWRTSPAGVKDSDRLVWLYNQNRKHPVLNRYFSYSEYQFYKDQNPVFADILAYTRHQKFSVQSGDRGDSLYSSFVSGNSFSLLGVQPAAGRILTAEDDRPNSHPVVFLSYRLWDKFFNRDPSIVGKEIRVNRAPVVVIGVASQQFTGISMGSSADIYIPLAMQTLFEVKPDASPRSSDDSFQLAARLKPGVSLAQANAAMKIRAKQIPSGFPYSLGNEELVVSDIAPDHPRRDIPIFQFFGLLALMSALILLIPCNNIASLLLARAIDRRKEMGLRTALGAARGRIVGQLLTEALLLGLCGGAFGMLCASWMASLLSSRRSLSDLPGPAGLGLDATIVCFVLALSILTSLVFGAIPALHMMRSDLTAALKDQELQKLWIFRRLGARNMLVVTNIAVSLVVLILAGFLLQSVYRTKQADLGFSSDNLLIVPLDLALNQYSESRAQQFNSNLLSRINALPGIYSASLASSPILQTASVSGNRSESGKSILPGFTMIGRDFFKTLNIPIVRGRGFSDNEFSPDVDVIVINEAMAQKLWPGQEALGRKIEFFMSGIIAPNGMNVHVQPRVVGIAKDRLLDSLGSGYENTPRELIFLPMPERCNRDLTLYVRTTGHAGVLASVIQESVLDLEPQFSITGIKTLSDQTETRMKENRFLAIIMGILGLFALGLASMGLYGVVSYAVGRRTREIGVRIAMGASRANVLRQLIAEGMVLTGIGLVVGIFLAWSSVRMLLSRMTDMQSSGPLAYLAACLLLAIVALGACYVPVRKALDTNPMDALRYE